MSSKIPYLIPIGFLTFIALGSANYKTLVIGFIFALSFVSGIMKGQNLNWTDHREKYINENRILYIYLIGILLIFLQLLLIRKIPLLDPMAKGSLDPILMLLIYLLGVPSSIYLFMYKKKLSIFYPILITLFGYRTPFLVVLIGFIAHYVSEEREISNLKLISIVSLGILGLFGVTLVRGGGIESLLIRLQATTSVLDSIVNEFPLYGHYFGSLQWAGIDSYIIGGFSPRALTARLLGIRSGVTITSTLLGGMYIDFGIFSVVEGFILGAFYGVLSQGDKFLTKTIYYTTLAYGLVGIETGILDLPVYILFLIGFWIIFKNKYIIRWEIEKR